VIPLPETNILLMDKNPAPLWMPQMLVLYHPYQYQDLLGHPQVVSRILLPSTVAPINKMEWTLRTFARFQGELAVSFRFGVFCKNQQLFLVYTATWGILYHLPPIKGTRKLHCKNLFLRKCWGHFKFSPFKTNLKSSSSFGSMFGR